MTILFLVPKPDPRLAKLKDKKIIFVVGGPGKFFLIFDRIMKNSEDNRIRKRDTM